MKLTLSQRHKYYKEALGMLEDYNSHGVCYLLCLAYGNASYNFQGRVLNYFPEFKAKKPTNVSKDKFWWNWDDKGNKKRLAALRACIRETAPKKKPITKNKK